MDKKYIKYGVIGLVGAASVYLLYRTYKYLFVTFTDMVKVILKNEGGLVNNPADPGGLTNMGVSQRAYPNLDIRNLSKAQAEAIYKKDYWDKLGISGINDDNLKLHILDHGVNAGTSSAAKLLQQLVKEPKTGIITADTVKKANAYIATGMDLTKYYKELRKSDYRTKSNYGTFGKAWEARVDKTKLSFL
jgi:lysozyme family protein